MNPRNNSASVRRSHSDKFSIADFDRGNDEPDCLRAAARRVAERKRRRRSFFTLQKRRAKRRKPG
jgi:hypothetical protein